MNDGEGQVQLSVRKLQAERGSKVLEDAFENKTVLKAVVTEISTGGLSVVVDQTLSLIHIQMCIRDRLKAEANDEDEAAAFEAGFSAWEDAKEELGAVSEIKEDSADVSYENQNKLYVVSVDGTFDKRDAVVTVTFDKKGNLSSVAFNGVYTLGEKM